MVIANPCVLVVDDEPVNLLVVIEHFNDIEQSYEIETADGGETALAMLEAEPGRFDMVLLDRMMPGMDGMEVLAKMKQHVELNKIPVILQTACATEEEILEGMTAGAHYYLTKPFDDAMFHSVVSTATRDRMQYRQLVHDLAQQKCSMKILQSGCFRLRTLEESTALAVQLAGVCRYPERALVGISELLTNAIEHGNLGIGYQEKTDLNQSDMWLREVESRLMLDEYRHKVVTVEFVRLEDYVELVIADEGKGFEWQKFLSLSTARATDNHGRGIAMAKILSFCEMEYLDGGNRVRVRIEG